MVSIIVPIFCFSYLVFIEISLVACGTLITWLNSVKYHHEPGQNFRCHFQFPISIINILTLCHLLSSWQSIFSRASVWYYLHPLRQAENREIQLYNQRYKWNMIVNFFITTKLRFSQTCVHLHCIFLQSELCYTVLATRLMLHFLR